jgi:hypothetical protein
MIAGDAPLMAKLDGSNDSGEKGLAPLVDL